MKNLLLLSIFFISSFFNFNNFNFSQTEKKVEDGFYKAKFEKEIIANTTGRNDGKITAHKTFGYLEIKIIDNSIAEINSKTNSETDLILQRLVGQKLNFNKEGIATTTKVSQYINDNLKGMDSGKTINYNLVVNMKEKL